MDIDAEVFPKADHVPQCEFGNLVWLPYWHGSVGNGNCFLCPDEFVPYVANPRAVYRHAEDDVIAAIGELCRGAPG